jgi:hypothetical protein
MPFSWMFQSRVAILSADISEERSGFIIRVTRIGELGIALAVTNRRRLVTANDVPCSLILVALMREALIFSVTSVLTRATRRNIPEDDILYFIIN